MQLEKGIQGENAEYGLTIVIKELGYKQLYSPSPQFS